MLGLFFLFFWMRQLQLSFSTSQEPNCSESVYDVTNGRENPRKFRRIEKQAKDALR